jgi:PAS domain S-box-containing protein
MPFFVYVGECLGIDNHELSVVLDSAPVGIALLGTDRKVRYCNPAFAKIYGWSSDELIGETLPVPEHQLVKWHALLRQLRMGKEFHDEETVRIRKDGTEFYVRISGVPVFDQRGNLDALVGFVAVPEANYSNQLELRSLRYLVQSSSDFMCVTDLELKTVFMNDPGREMMGLSKNKDLVGTSMFNFFSDESVSQILGATDSAMATGGGPPRRLRLKHALTAEYIPVACNVFLIRDPHTSEPAFFTFIANNLSDQQRLEEQLEHNQRAFAPLLQATPVAVALVNPSGFPIDSNEAFRGMLGYSAEELTKVPFASFVHPDDLAAGRGLFLDLIAGKIENYQVAKRLVDRHGESIDVHMSVSLVRGPRGEPKHTISIVRRVTSDAVEEDLDHGAQDLPRDPIEGYETGRLQ